ncbi:site-specific integrase [Sphingomicrobium sp. XHP0235]|uniref:tyrosine-type recombinase/integrase n=1 Tax=Sphingomicrobium aquimarinum TaxID=3133971 RepID=UPI0031FF13C0
MEAADPEDKRHVYAYPRRWFCDPTTDLLIRRWRVDHAASRTGWSPSPNECFAAFLLSMNNSSQGETLDQLVHEAALRWRLALPGLLVSHAVGDGPALSLPPTTWDRVSSGRPIAATKPLAKPTTRGRPNRTGYPEVYRSLICALKGTEPKKQIAEILDCISKQDDTLVAHLVRWANLAILPRGKTSNGRREWGQKAPYSARGTIAGYATKLADLLSENLETNLGGIDAAELDSFYRRGFEKIGDRNKALNAVSSFQAYLCALNPELDVGDTYDELREEGRVSVNMVSSADYLRALEQLPGNGREDRLLRLILTLAFRAGLRLNEILGLRHVDIAYTDSPSGAPLMELYVRPYGWRALKTKQSRRMVPLDVLLTPHELNELRTWCEDYEAEARNRPLGLLFTHAGGGAGELISRTVRPRLEKALIRATGDKGMSFEHLRHSFATQLLACLLLPKDGSYLSIPAGLDDDSISEARRERIIARVSGSARPGRSAMHIVSQLCGHGPVTTTLRWYSHMLDWSLGAFVNRKCLQPRLTRQLALSALKRTQEGYRAESLSRADHRFRRSISQRDHLRGEWENYRTPNLTPQVDWANDDIPLMAVHRSIQRGLDRQCADDFIPRSRPLRRRKALVSDAAGDTLPPWRSIREAVIALRAGSDADEQAALLGATKEEVIRYREIADVIAGPRRRGEKHMRFEPKMSSSKRAVFDVEDWRNIFPQEPRGRDALDVVDHIWRNAQRVHTHAHVRWALEEFCRYHSVDNGVTTFMKRKDATRFWRGMAMLGFAENMSVRPLGSKSCCDQLRWQLTRGLPKALRPPEPTTRSSRDVPFPRSIAIQIGVPRLPGRRFEDPVKTNNHTRSAVRFAITMVAIATLDDVREPPRRTGRRPGYGGYF